ncbi:MAG: carboxypeptidase-like regulatory domain-containing protein [Saprospirales bacterium]|nr:carboxypeptidase-like regulatory domain-containing protein [Saprospirales bacterium]
MRTGFLFLALFGLVAPALAQTSLHGVVLSTGGDTLVGANVWLPGTYDGATSDPNGRFAFQTDTAGARMLLVTCIGYDTFRQELQLAGGLLRLELRLHENASALQEVVISAGSFEAASDRRRAVVLTPLDIALTASATADIAGAIATLPGTTRNGESGQILVRGGAAYETRTFIDGLYVQNPYNSTVPNVPARNRFSPFLFKGTQFSTGGYSAEYGQALSSALILNTEDLAPQTTTGLSLMSVGLGLAHTKRWERRSLAVSGTYTNLSPYFALVPQTIQWMDAPQSAGGELIFRQQTSEAGILKVYASFNRSWMEMQYPDPFRPQETLPLRLEADNVYTNVSYRDILNGKWILFAGGAYTFNRDQVASGFGNDQEQQSGQMRVALTRPLGEKIKVKFGTEYLQGRFNETYRDGAAGHYHTLRKERYTAGFAETDLFFSRKWVARAGLRTEYSALLGRANLAPRVSAAYVLGKNEQVAFAAGQFYQTPEYQLLRSTTDFSFEQATHYMLNYQRIRDGFTFRIEGYYKEYDHLVKTAADASQANNRGNGFARGLDVFFRDQRTFRNVDYWVSYAFLDTKRDYRDFPGAAIPVFAATHNVSVVYKQWFPKHNTAFGATFAFQSPRPYHNPNRPGFNQGRTPAYNDLSVNASYLTNLWGHFTILYVSATNIFGFKQVYGYQYGEAPDATGLFPSRTITPPAKRFLFIGLFINFGQRYRADAVTTEDI